jgi:hypothetical protein
MGRFLLSRVDPVAQGEKLAQALTVRGRTLYYCPSPLFGYGLNLILDKLPADSAVLCIETDEQLYGFSLGNIGGDILNHPRLRFVRMNDPATLCAYVEDTWGKRAFRRLETVKLSGGWRLFPQIYDAFAGALERNIVTEWGNAMTIIRLGRRYSRNTIRNLGLLSGARSVRALFFDKPVLVLGAGPSLDPALDALAACFGGAPNKPRADGLSLPSLRPFAIICVDTCLPSLYERNVRPDLVVVLESQLWNLRDFIGLGRWNIPLAMDISSLNAHRNILGGETYLFTSLWSRPSLFERLNAALLLPAPIPPLGSVGLCAAALALELSAAQVVTCGLDFSFSPDSFHARSSPGHLEKLRRQNRFRSLLNGEAVFRKGTFKTRAKNGEQVYSNPGLKSYRDLFEQEFARNGSPAREGSGTEQGKDSRAGRLFDITGTGLPLGIPVLSPEEAFAVLTSDAPARPARPVPALPDKALVRGFIKSEREKLAMLKETLAGARPSANLEELLDYCSYLWLYFPECAGTNGTRPSAQNISFLKRVRTEIDPFLRDFDTGLLELEE